MGRPTPHLVACVASHGWGHLSQTIPMVAALHARLPGLRTTVRTALPAPLVRARFEAVGLPAPDVSADDTDFGFVMHDALRVDDEASLARYRAMLAARDTRLDRERDALRALRADLVLANIGWLPIAAASSLGLPAFGACSLNWAWTRRRRTCRFRCRAVPTAWSGAAPTSTRCSRNAATW